MEYVPYIRYVRNLSLSVKQETRHEISESEQ
jgi:hypothetical protein